ncbi:MAG: hypothetical protein KJ622_12375 [Alphaproteobacteria bacterium]|nr:hypothetical protein [Alphaproteobacteria bacterium]
MRRGWAVLLVALTSACVVASLAGQAEARVVCNKGYRIIKGHQLGTPYCQDLYLAQVAREFGSRVSAREILNNPSVKREVCQFMGWDIRVQHICDAILPKRGPF